MRELYLQVLPERAPGIDIEDVTRRLQAVCADPPALTPLNVTSGEDNGPYYNYLFATEYAREHWDAIRDQMFGQDAFGRLMRRSTVVCCSMEDGWDDYLLLGHFDRTLLLDKLEDE